MIGNIANFAIILDKVRTFLSKEKYFKKDP